jgi:regulator of nucleoside diphosphate kinase
VNEKQKWIGCRDRVRLCRFIGAWEERLTRDREQIAKLRARVRASVAVPAEEVPPTVVTMNTQVRVRDLDSGHAFVWTVSLPPDDEVAVTARSPFSWSGATLLGAREGDELQWKSRRGLRRVRIEAVLFQPEAQQRTQSRSRMRARGERKIVPDVRSGAILRRGSVSASGMLRSSRTS